MSNALEPIATLNRTLSNGLKVCLIATDCKMYHIQLGIKVGMFSEANGEYEFAHFLEHLNAQFTSKKYPVQKEIISKIESFGVAWNAFTTTRHTGYFIKGFCDDLDIEGKKGKNPFWKILDVVRESYFDFEIDDSVFMQEINAVVQELSGYQCSAETIIEETHNAAMYPNHPITITVSDRLNNMKTQARDTLSFKRKILQFRQKYYGPNNAVLTIAVPVGTKNGPSRQLEKVFDEITGEGKYGGWNKTWQGNSMKVPRDIMVTPGNKTNSIKIFQLNSDPGVRSTILVSLKLNNLKWNDHKIKLAIRFICHKLAGGFDSLLMKELRTKEGLIYSIHAYGEYDLIDPNLNCLNIQTSCDPENATKVHHLITQQLKELYESSKQWKDSDLQKFKTSERYLFQGLEVNKDPSKWVDRYSVDMLFGRDVYTFTKIKSDLEMLLIDDVKAAMNILFSKGEIYITFNAPKKSEKKMNPHVEMTEIYEQFLRALLLTRHE